MRYLIYIIRLRIKAMYQYVADYYEHIRYYTNYHLDKSKSKDMKRCAIMLLNHQLEKAQTYSNMKENYGKEKVKNLLRRITRYASLYGVDSLIITSVGVIESHLCNKFSYKDDSLVKEFEDFKTRFPVTYAERGGGVLFLEKKDFLKNENLLNFMKSRHSCRVFSSEEITELEINKAIEYAMTAPSACNRQAVRAHYYSSKSIIEKIVMAQKADIAWCLYAKGLFVVTANKSYYRDFLERNQGMFDSGLFSMALVLGLQNLGIASCFKMAQKSVRIDSETKKIAQIPDQEDICILLLVGKFPNEKIITAKSERILLKEILTFHE